MTANVQYLRAGGGFEGRSALQMGFVYYSAGVNRRDKVRAERCTLTRKQLI